MSPSKEKKESIAFHIASSNMDILEKIQHLLEKNGYIGLKDGYGRFHYMIDGRKGAPYATRKIKELAYSLLKKKESNEQELMENARFYVDSVMNCYNFPTSTNGYVFLRYILIEAVMNPSLLRSLSKGAYLQCAQAFGAKANQVERDIRYCLFRLAENEKIEIEKEEKVNSGASFSQFGKLPEKRVLIKGKDHYSNGEAIHALYGQIKKIIRRDTINQ